MNTNDLKKYKDYVVVIQHTWPLKRIQDFTVIRQISINVKHKNTYDEYTLNLQKKLMDNGDIVDRMIWSKAGKYLLEETDVKPSMRVFMEGLAKTFKFEFSELPELVFPLS